MQAYHGSCNSPFEEFDLLKSGSGIVGSRYRGVIFLTTNLETARYFTDTNGHVSLWELTVEKVEELEGVSVCEALEDGFPVYENEDGDIAPYDALICKNIIDGYGLSDVIVICNPDLAHRIEVVESYPSW